MSARRGHLPTLIASFLHFDLSFTLWSMLGALGAVIGAELHLDPARRAWVVALPILTGSLLRIPLGVLADRIGSRKVGLAMLVALYVPLSLGAFVMHGFASVLLVGALLGVAGASFAVALPLASRWYPPERQGVVMGLAAAGNGGTVIASLAAPMLARGHGLRGVFLLAMVPLTVVLIAFWALAREAPKAAPSTPVAYLDVVRERDMRWLCLFYGVTFGGYVGLTGFLPTYTSERYGIDPVTAGSIAASVAAAGSLVRPIGGWLADRLGATRILSMVFPTVAALWLVSASMPPLQRATVAFVAMALALGIGNGAVFQIVPLRFGDRLGAATGWVGALGGVAGFFLPTILGTTKHVTGSYGAGFVFLALFALSAFVSLRVLVARREGWRIGFRMAAVAAVPSEASEAQ